MKRTALALVGLLAFVTYDTKPRPLIGQGGAPPSVTEYAEMPAVDGPYFGFVREVRGLQTPGTTSYKVAGYFAAETGKRGDGVYPLNVVAQWNAGDPRSDVIGFELDLNNNNSDVGTYQAPLVNGFLLASGGAFHPGTALHIGSTTPENAWRTGIEVSLDSVTDVGIKVGRPTPGLVGSVLIRQLKDSETLLLQRKSDTARVGSFIRAVNAVNDRELFVVDIEGRVFAHGLYDEGINLLTVIRQLQAEVAELKRRVK